MSIYTSVHTNFMSKSTYTLMFISQSFCQVYSSLQKLSLHVLLWNGDIMYQKLNKSPFKEITIHRAWHRKDILQAIWEEYHNSTSRENISQATPAKIKIYFQLKKAREETKMIQTGNLRRCLWITTKVNISQIQTVLVYMPDCHNDLQVYSDMKTAMIINQAVPTL